MTTTEPPPVPPTALPAPVLECVGLERSFDGRRAVDGIGFRVAPGETYGLLGPNGAGKTTTIRMVCGLLRSDAGAVTVRGHTITATAHSGKDLVGYVPQEIALYPDLTAQENLRFFGRLYGMRGAGLDRRVEEVLELVDLTERRDDRVESFSGGMKRRLNIGAGLVHRPSLLVLDEPTVGVDPQSRHAIMDGVRALSASGMAVLYTTHYMEEAERLCDRIGIIDHGRMIAEGTRRELIDLVAGRDRIALAASGDLAGFAAATRGVAGIESADVADDTVHLVASGGRSLLPALLDTADRCGVTVRSVEVVEPDLEAVFLHLTGTSLRE